MHHDARWDGVKKSYLSNQCCGKAKPSTADEDCLSLYRRGEVQTKQRFSLEKLPLHHEADCNRHPNFHTEEWGGMRTRTQKTARYRTMY